MGEPTKPKEIMSAMDALLKRAEENRRSMPGGAMSDPRTRVAALVDRQELSASSAEEKDAIPALAAALAEVKPERRKKIIGWAMERLELLEAL